jgi:hypothetical protein
MIKVIMMLDCNICGQPFEEIVTSSQVDPLSWKSLSLDLEYTAESSGWFFFRNSHFCSYCVYDVACVRYAEGAARGGNQFRRFERSECDVQTNCVD